MSLIGCIGKLSGGKNKTALSLEDKQELHARAAEHAKTMPRAEAEAKAVSDLLDQAQENHDYIKSEIAKAAPEAAKRAPASPDNAPEEPVSGEPRVIARKEKPKTLMDHIHEAVGSKDRNAMDYAANKFLGKAHSLLAKMDNAGESGAWSKVLKGKVSAEFANAQSNNAMTLAYTAAAEGHMVIEKIGAVSIVRDSKNNVKALSSIYKKLGERLASIGYKDEGAHENDPNTIVNAAAMALYGPRMHELVKIGQMDSKFFTAADKKMSDELRAHPEIAPLVKEYQDTYNTLRQKAIDAMVESGIYTEKKAKEYMDRAEYLPLYRMDESLQNTLGEASHMGSLLAAAKEHKLGTGSEAGIGDPVLNSLNNLVWLNTRAIKNNTANIFGDALTAVGSAEWARYNDHSVRDPNVVTFNRDGEKVALKLHDINDVSAFTAAPVLTGFGWNMARTFTNALRKGITMMPGFVWGQTSQDAQRVAIRTGQGFARSYKDVASAMVHEARGGAHENPEQAILRAYGVVAARDFVDGADSFRKDILDKPSSKAYHIWHSTIEGLERLAAASDGASREAAYKAKLAEVGDTPEGRIEAVHAARMLIDFNNRGNSRSLAVLMTVVPFINARIQGTHRMVDALRGKIPGVDPVEAQKMVAMQVGKMMAFTLAYTLIKQNDDEYENETPQGRNNNFMFPGGLKMPVASELLPFKVLAETTARQMLNDPHEDWSKSRSAVTSSLGTLLLGPQDMVPTLGKPFIESLTNHSFSTGNELVGQSLQGKSASMQFNTGTTEFAKALSEGTESVASMLGMKKGAGVSPIVLENFLTGFTGRVGQETLNLLKLAEAGVGARALPKINEVPLVGSMFMNPEGNAMRTDFQEVADAVSIAQKDLKTLRDSGDFKGAQAYMKENQKLLSLQGRIVPIQQRLTALNKQLKQGEPSAEKRDRIYAQQMQVLSQVMEIRKAAGF